MIKDKEYYEGLDKRTSEYKEYVKFNRIVGEPKTFTVKDIKEAECRYKLIVDFNKPKEMLRPLTKEQYKAYKEYKDERTLDVWGSIDMLVDTYAHVFELQHNKLELTKESKGAFKKLSKMSRELDVVFESYNNKNKG